MTDQPDTAPVGRGDRRAEIAAHRQLARWSNRPQLSPHQHGQRNALKRAVRSSQDTAFAGGCELHASTDEQRTDA